MKDKIAQYMYDETVPFVFMGLDHLISIIIFIILSVTIPYIAKKHLMIGSNVKIKFVKDRPGHDIRYALNSKKIYKTLNWKAKIDIENGLEKTFLWYFKNRKYFNQLSKKDIIKRLGKND